ncbi:MAG: metallophosphoesterase family protein [Deltaproteobacteria bacterium]|nr:metallophosphoesterase family protein [Deltaproteobacteria bacterium]
MKAGDAFETFRQMPQDIICGPYSLGVTTNGALIAWEERQGRNGFRHVEVEVAGLKPGTAYRYRVNGCSRDGKFVTPPSATDNRSSFSFFVWGDSRTGNEVGELIIGEMLEREPEACFAVHTGDMVEDGDLVEDWEQHWWSPMDNLLAAIPVYPVMGNHEVNSAWYQRYFGGLGGGGMNYSFDWGRVHFVVVDANRVNFGTAEQLAWLEADLREHSDAEFTVVSHHIPVYFSSPGHAEGVTGMAYLQDSLLSMYENNGVDLVLSGDVHSFQHHVKNDIHYLISAGGGEKPYEHGLPLDNMTLSLAQDYHYGVGRYSEGSLHMSVYTPDGTVLDDFELGHGGSTEIQTGAQVVCDRETIARGESLKLDIYLKHVSNLEEVTLRLEYAKREPELVLFAQDQDLFQDGVQVEPGELGGTLQCNLADNRSGILEYAETHLGGLTAERILVATLNLTVPEDAWITALYFVPRFNLLDTFGKSVPVFMDGVKVVIRPE